MSATRVPSVAALCISTFALLAGSAWAQDEPAGSAVEASSTAAGLEKKTLKLPAAAENVIVAGAGKYLIAHLKSAQKLAVIDVKESKITKYISLTAGDAIYAAGAEKLFIALPEQRIIQRWSLETFEREVSVPLPAGFAPAHMVLGHAALGPILLGPQGDFYRGGGFMLLNPKTLQPIGNDGENRSGRSFECNGSCVVRASPNGQVFTSWRTGVSPSGFFTLVLNGEKAETYYEHTSLGLLLPNFDGSRIYAGGRVYTNKTTPLTAGDRAPEGTCLPSVTGDYYITIAGRSNYRRGDGGGKNPSLTVQLAGDSRPIVTLPDVAPASPGRGSNRESRLYDDNRIFYFPDLSKLVVLTGADDAFDVIALDLDKELEKSGIDYLFVTSRPPLSATPGKPLEYQLAVKSKKSGVKMSLASGPEGMKLSPTGKLTWAVPAAGAGEVDVIISVSDSSGQEVFQTFRLATGGNTPASAASVASSAPASRPPRKVEERMPEETRTDPKAKAVAQVDPSSGGALRLEPVKLPALTSAKITGDKMQIKLPAAAEKMEVGGGGRYVILHLKSLRKLAVVDLCEAKIAGFIPADDDNVAYAAGASKLVMGLPEKRLLARWNLETLTREVTVPFDGVIASLTMGSASNGPVLVQTSSGTPAGRSGPVFLDLAKLRPIDFNTSNNNGYIDMGSGARAHASADGRTFCMPGSFGGVVVTFDGQNLKLQRSEYTGNTASAGMGIPGPDGQIIYVGGTRLSQQLRLLSKGTNSGMLVPATHGRLYLAVELGGEYRNRQASRASVYIDGDSRPLITLDDFSFGVNEGDMYGRSSLALDKRIVLVPDAKVLATLDTTADALTLRKFDLDQALEAAGIDYLFVSSTPPLSVRAGDSLRYEIKVKSKKGGVKYRFESGPEGMALSPQGVLTWKASGQGAQSVIVAISDSSDQEIFHTFQIFVEDDAAKAPPASTTARDSDAARAERAAKLAGEAVKKAAAAAEAGARAAEQQTPAPASETPPAKEAWKTEESLTRIDIGQRIGQTHTWKDATTGRTLEGKLLGVEKGKVKVAKASDELTVLIPLDRLSREDLVWLLGAAP